MNHSFIARCVGLFMLFGVACSEVQTLPNGPVKFIVPLTAGAGADTAARLLAQSLRTIWKQPVVIDNRPGAGGLIGTGAVVWSRMD